MAGFWNIALNPQAMQTVKSWAEAQGMPTYTANAITPAGAGRPGGLGLGRALLSKLLQDNQFSTSYKDFLYPTLGMAVAGLLARALGAPDEFSAGLVKGGTSVGLLNLQRAQELEKERQKALRDWLNRELELENQLALQEAKARGELAKLTYKYALEKMAEEEKDKQIKANIQRILPAVDKINWADPQEGFKAMLIVSSILPPDRLGKLTNYLEESLRTNLAAKRLATETRLRQRELGLQAYRTLTQPQQQKSASSFSWKEFKDYIDTFYQGAPPEDKTVLDLMREFADFKRKGEALMRGGYQQGAQATPQQIEPQLAPVRSPVLDMFKELMGGS